MLNYIVMHSNHFGFGAVQDLDVMEDLFMEIEDIDDVFEHMMYEEEEQFKNVAALFFLGTSHYEAHYNKTSRILGPESGHDWVLRNLADNYYSYTMFRMSTPLFHQLHDTLVQSYGLQSTSKVSSFEALGLFLWMIGAPQSVRQAENRFGRSPDTVVRIFDKVLRVVLGLAGDIINPRDRQFRFTHNRMEHHKFSPHFNNCIGAIDGTHVDCIVPAEVALQYLNQYHRTSQNVLVVCDFDMRFTFVEAGWSGSVHDARVLNDATTKYSAHFPHPPQGKKL